MDKVNFKRVDINAFTMVEADEVLATKVTYSRFQNATQAWKNAGSPAQNTSEFKEFCAKYLADKCKNKPGLGAVIVYEAGKADTRERPYTLTDVVNEKGKRKYKTTYVIMDVTDPKEPKILAKTQENKAKAKEIAKDLYIKDGFRGKAICKYTKEVVEGETTAFEINYQPSKSAKKGCFIYFGVEAN